MIPLLAAYVLSAQSQELSSAIPKGGQATVSDEIRDWSGFKYLPMGPRTLPSIFRVSNDWSALKPPLLPNAAVWRIKVVLLERVDRDHERGPGLIWPGHHGLSPTAIASIKRSLEQFRTLVQDETKGACDLRFDVSEETQALEIGGGDLGQKAAEYLLPRINGGKYEAEDGAFRGPYASVLVIHPLGAESQTAFDVQGATVDLVGLPDIEGVSIDGELALALNARWKREVAMRASLEATSRLNTDDALAAASPSDWSSIIDGANASTDEYLRLAALKPSIPAAPSMNGTANLGPRSPNVELRLEKDVARGTVLTMEERGEFRGGGFVLPVGGDGAAVPSIAQTPTLAFWAKSEAKDPIALSMASGDATRSVALGFDVPFAYDNAWHRVKVDLRSLSGEKSISRLSIGPDKWLRARLRQTFGPIAASFSDFELTSEAADAKPTSEAPSPTASDPEARAQWAASASPGDERRALMKDAFEAVKANAVTSALLRPDPADEPALIEDSLYTFEPTVFTPALRALSKLSTPTAHAAIQQALRIAAADRARGFAAELLAEKDGDKAVPLMIGLNQARTRSARIAAVRALARIPGSEAALMRMAYLAQDDPEVKLAVTRTADPNDDYQGRKLLWSAVNEPSDAVRLESLRRLSFSSVPEFIAEGLKGVRDDSVGVRVGLLGAWMATPNPRAGDAIRVAIQDRAPRVRAAALEALAAYPEPVIAKDVPFDDPDPRVELAALRLAAAKKIGVPPEIRERLKKSPFPAVRAAALASL